MKSVIKKTVNAIEYILLALIFIAIIFVFISNSQGKPFFVFGKSIVWVMTESMEPEIQKQSYILVEKTEPDKIAVGDVILFHSDDPALAGNINTHRVVEIIDNGKEFVTKGDNNPVNDNYTAKAQKTIAVYKKSLPTLTIIGRFIATPIGLAASILSIFAVIFLLYYPDMKKMKKAWDIRIAQEKQKEFDRRVLAEVERLKSQKRQDKQKEETEKEDAQKEKNEN